ncbi:hypothetical protein COM04_12175 [Bacillus wiedmannii]|nr:hypothetical protein DN394_01860 [Bacillus sp. BB081]PEO62118.1 hypothetical protein CN560_02540 [Bacillus wiedmannii]PGB97017.1 hypothetical protein COM04_12175 [Bacillus wiedmannii]PHB55120.1 hypothetical protein COE92_12845 [Bacillus wiedmannii]PHE02668.1 hypothetical protein COF56_18060 [Bacillus wiedmannii]
MQYFHRDLAPTQSLLIHSYFHASLIGISLLIHLLPRYSRAVKPPPQNSAKIKKLGVGLTARKSPIGPTNNQWGINPSPTD